MSLKARVVGTIGVLGVIGVLAIAGVGRLAGADEPSTPAADAPSTASSAAPSTSSSSTAAVTSTSGAQDPYTVVAVVDGDTIRVRPAGSATEQKVRLIGIDAPETGSCEASSATAALQELLRNRPVTLTLGGDGEDLDPYGRALRYVDTADGDAGLAMISGGHAIARYDSRDGYGRHDREAAYLAADAASPAYVCAATTVTDPGPSTVADPAPLAAPIPAADDAAGPTPTGHGATTSSQAPAAASYPNCAAARAAGVAPLHAGEPGYSTKLDRDGDGVACE